MKKRVVIAMSGGVDSSVSAALLQEQGYECIGVHLKMWEDTAERHAYRQAGSEAASKNKCCNLNGVEDSRWVCEKLGIPFYVMNVEQDFKERVVDYFLEGYGNGQTPNPCVECNRTIKFGELLRRAEELNADAVATGHYARVSCGTDGRFSLLMAADRSKDQSYFLYTLTQEKLAKILFPVGDMQKSEVYEVARSRGLVRVCEKPQSQGLCFFAEGDPHNFLMRYLPKEAMKPGPITDVSGREIGTHRGLSLYTKGQRHGLGIGGIRGEPEGEPWYVIAMERERNTLIVGRESDTEQDFFECDGLSFIGGKIPQEKLEVCVRIRHRGELVPAVLEVNNGSAKVCGRKSFRSVACGQSAVFYKGEEVIGGGVIASRHPELGEGFHKVQTRTLRI